MPLALRPWARLGLAVLALASVLASTTTTARAARYEAESASLTGVATATTRAGYSGSGYVTGFDADNDAATFTVSIPSAGYYDLKLRHYTPGRTKTSITIGTYGKGEYQFIATQTGFVSMMANSFYFAAGSHTIVCKYVSGFGGFELDALDLDPSPATASRYEAESATLLGGVLASSANPGFSGTGFADYPAAADAATSAGIMVRWSNVRPVAGVSTRLLFRYANGGTTARDLQLVVNGSAPVTLSFAPSGGWSTYATHTGPAVNLNLVNTIELRAAPNQSGPNIDRLDLDLVVPAVGTRFEAETGSRYETTTATTRTGYTGSGYVSNFITSTSQVDIPVHVATTGQYRLTLRAAAPSARKLRILVNGHTEDDGDNYQINSTGAWVDLVGPIISLGQGLNFIGVRGHHGGFDLDRLDLALQSTPPALALTSVPVNPKATPEVLQLFHYLRHQQGKTILSGQVENTADLSYVRGLTGKYPAIIAQDFINYTASYITDNGPTLAAHTASAIDWHRGNKGVITIQWHWKAPSGGNYFSSSQTTFDVRQAVIPGTPEHTLALADIDEIAGILGRYASLRIPILWRPLHEASGTWFWWGKHGPTPCKQLWAIIYDRLVNHHGLNNLLWVWNSHDPAWYPGDATVDIVSRDEYRPLGNHYLPPRMYNELVTLAAGKKIIALAENGPMPDPDLLLDGKSLYSWFLNWEGSFTNDRDQNPESHFQYVYNHPAVITRDEMIDLRATEGIRAYTATNYGGTLAGLPTGDYNLRALRTRLNSGTTTVPLLSFRVSAGSTVTVYSGDNYTGTSQVLTADTASLAATGFTGTVQSLRVREAQPTGTFRIVARHTGKCLGATGTTSGSSVQQQTYTGDNRQKWTVASLGSGRYKITNVASGLALEVNGGATTDGALLRLVTTATATQQEWTLPPQTTGYSNLRNVRSGKSARVVAASTNDGANIEQFTDSTADAQQWVFVAP